MNADDFVYNLPEELIAARPAEPRDASRLMVLQRGSDAAPEHRRFADIIEYLRPGDLLILNDSKVLPARLFATRATGGRAEILLLNIEPGASGDATWRALVRPARKLHVGETLTIAPDLSVLIEEEHPGGERTLRFLCDGSFRPHLERHGHMPLPPYIVKARERAGMASELPDDATRYQTVYAQAEGSIAAPTAGLHFTPELFARLDAMGVERAHVTLHVGAGTFQGMAEGSSVAEHKMHFEEYEVGAATLAALRRAKADGRRIIAVGTTSARTVESLPLELPDGPLSGRTDIMITPGYQWKFVSGLVTNFHLPRTTLLLLVSALINRERLLGAYAEAVREGYRFYSYGDAMLIL